ncbi:MAG: HEAT repeat domain-containing protein, partial [Candidatus Sumerlaeia bacterium]|nr:HEAT repeat domain-containing protein [Candidatus Sumerlaeia bacterium]
IEAARDIVRRLNWSLTEESGAIGWGAPEAIGEICARHEQLAAEFGSVLLSYLYEPNDLGNPVLLRGALWGLGRLAELRPHLLRQYGCVEKIKPYLESPDAALRRLSNHVIACLNANASDEAALRG